MRKFYILTLFVVVFYPGLYAQGYHPMIDDQSNNWTFVSNMLPVRVQQSATPCDYTNFAPNASSYFTVSDTVINSVTYKTLYSQVYNDPLSMCLYGFIREDTSTRQVYFMDHDFNQEVLIYDFGMVPGDSINLTFINTWGAMYFDGYYVLDSISTVMTNAGPRNLFHLNQSGMPFQYPLQWIESVGHPGHLIYPYSLNFSGGMMFWCTTDNIRRELYQLLTCFEHNSQKVYFDSCAHAFAYNNWCFNYEDSCNYWNICGAVEEVSAIANVEVNPNPSSSQITLRILANRNEDVELYISDMTGKSLLKKLLHLEEGLMEENLDIQSMLKGVYQLELRSKSGVRMKRIVRI